MRPNGPLPLLSFLVVWLAAATVLAQRPDPLDSLPPARTGLFLSGGVGVAGGNFNAENQTDGSKLGPYFEVSGGWAFTLGPGAIAPSAGFSVSHFSYDIQLEDRAGDLQTGELAMTFVTLDAAVSYFLPLDESVELMARIGLSQAESTAEFGARSDNGSAFGFNGAFGLGWFAAPSVSLNLDLYMHTHGATLEWAGDETVITGGALVGARWR